MIVCKWRFHAFYWVQIHIFFNNFSVCIYILCIFNFILRIHWAHWASSLGRNWVYLVERRLKSGVIPHKQAHIMLHAYLVSVVFGRNTFHDNRCGLFYLELRFLNIINSYRASNIWDLFRKALMIRAFPSLNIDRSPWINVILIVHLLFLRSHCSP